MITNLDKKCLHTVLENRNELPKYVPRQREFMTECDDYLYCILQDVRNNSLSEQNRSNLYFLNTIVLSKLGKLTRG